MALDTAMIMETFFRNAVNNTVALESLPPPEAPANIVNVVSTVDLLNKGDSLSLETIAVAMSGAAKFAHKRFAAIVIRIKDYIGTTTCLAFGSGKIVVVGALSRYHALYACQLYRCIIERIVSVYMDPISGRIITSNLVGRIQFQKWNIHNIVANSHAGCRPNLRMLLDLACDVSDWNPELFPGFHLLVWLKPKDQCTCTKKKKNRSCDCNCRVVLFDTGKMIITGCKDLNGIAVSKSRVRLLMMSEPSLQDNTEELPRNLRFQARREQMLKAAMLEFAGFRSKRKLDEEDDILTEVVPKTTTVTKRRKPAKTVSELDPFIKACVDGQLENVQFILSYDTSGAQKALEYIEQNVPEELRDEQIMHLLKLKGR
jgi:TATA-box binding protein (TBP) (component of TFIID and TFIIIB)